MVTEPEGLNTEEILQCEIINEDDILQALHDFTQSRKVRN